MRVIFKMYQTTSVASLLNITTDSEWEYFYTFQHPHYQNIIHF